MKIAQYRDTLSGYTYIKDCTVERYLGRSDIRISDYLEVEFVEITEAIELTIQVENKRKEAAHMLDDYKQKMNDEGEVR
jgi:hypothetical protein